MNATQRAGIILVLVAAALILATMRAHAGNGAIIGTNIGVAYRSGIATLSVPNGSPPLLDFSPTLRFGTFLDEKRQQELFGDLSLVGASASGTTLMNLQAMLSYQYASSQGATSPFVNVGAGFTSLGVDSYSQAASVLGLGIGVRHRLANGHGGIRAELRGERQFGLQRGYYSSLGETTTFGARFGFDLYVN